MMDNLYSVLKALRTRFSSAGLGSTLGLAVVAGFGMVILLSALI
jgi:hypothetical protein